MRMIIDTLSIEDALVKYPAGTEFVAQVSRDWIKNNSPTDEGYYCRYNMASYYTKDLEAATIWRLGYDDTNHWGSHMLACILKTGLTDEELAKMSTGQKLAKLLQMSKEPKESKYTKESIKDDLEKGVIPRLKSHSVAGWQPVLAMLFYSEFREQFLTDEERSMLEVAISRISGQLAATNKTITPNQRLVAALTKESGDIL